MTEIEKTKNDKGKIKNKLVKKKKEYLRKKYTK